MRRFSVYCRTQFVVVAADATNRNPTPLTTVTIPYIKGTSETISRIPQPYNICVVHRPTTTLRQLLTNVKDRDEPNNRQGAVNKIKCSDCQASYIGETDRNLKTRLTEHKRATRNDDANNHIAVRHKLTNHNIDWESAQCLTYSTNYYVLIRCAQTNVNYFLLKCYRNTTPKE